MLTIRPAHIDDARTLFDWRNDPLTRAMSRNDAPVAWEAHLAWLTDRLARPEPGLYLAHFFGRPSGTFRIDGDEISYTVAPEARGSGFGLLMLRHVKDNFGPLRAEIYARNKASIRIAERAGLHVHIIDG